MESLSNNEKTGGLLKKWHKIFFLFLLMIVLSFVLAFIFFVLNIRSEIKNSQFEGNSYYRITDNEKLKIIEGTSTNYWLGTNNPKITIVEFADFGCSRCKSSFPKIREATIAYNNDIKYIFRDYPVISSYSLDMAMAARCAGEQGLFWVMHDRLYMSTIQSKEDILKTAMGIGIDYEKFVTCLDSQKYLVNIKKDIDDANQLVISGTPTWFINGNRVEGDVPYEFLFGLINKLLGANK